jgi:hypothetical protein
MEVKEQYHIKIPKRFAALEDLDDNLNTQHWKVCFVVLIKEI